jgi:hypothetical protein
MTPEEKKALLLKYRNNDGQPLKDFIPYNEAKTWVSRLGFENYRQWMRFSKMRYKKGPLRGRLIRPKFVPANPQCSYKVRNQWVSDTDFLGKPTNPYLSFDEARQYALDLKLYSSYQWRKWHRENEISFIPRFPEFVYKEWTLWANFLGSEFIHYTKKEPYVPLQEAMRLVHEYRFENREEYREWIRQHTHINLPNYPEYVYVDWPGWDTFLGKSITDRIQIVQNITSAILYFGYYKHLPANVFEVRIERQGRFAIEERVRQRQFKVFKMFVVEDKDIATTQAILKANSSTWWEQDHTFLVNNIHELFFQLDVLLVSIT